MAKGQQRSNREAKKPKKAKAAGGSLASTSAAPKTTVSFGKAGLVKPKR